MASNEPPAKSPGRKKGILKRVHEAPNVIEDDDNPIKSILKKSKKPKLEAPPKNEQKVEQVSQVDEVKDKISEKHSLDTKLQGNVPSTNQELHKTDPEPPVSRSDNPQKTLSKTTPSTPIKDETKTPVKPNLNDSTVSPHKTKGQTKQEKDKSESVSPTKDRKGKHSKEKREKSKSKSEKGIDKRDKPVKEEEDEVEEIVAVQDPQVDRSRICPYLDTINRSVLDFDFEKLCSVSLSHINVYACLVCGKYFQGRGKMSHAYTHSVQDSHHVYLNLQTQKFYCLPDNYQIIDSSLEDIIYVLNPTFTTQQIRQMDSSSKMSIAYDKTTYLPGIVGLNNIKANDYCNVILQALSHVTPLRNYFLQESNYNKIKRPPGDQMCLLTQRFGELLRKLWNPRNFKAHVSPHEMLQAVVLCSKKKLQITEQGDAVEFMSWFLNAMHGALNGTRKLTSSIINKTFRGTMKVFTRKVLPIELSDEEKAKLMEQEDYQETMDEMPWLYLTCDLPAPPLYPDEMRENIIPQIPFSVLLSKFNGINEKEYKTYKDSHMKRFEITHLPPYIIIYIKRFSKNYFITEKNPTIVNFPIKNVDFGDLLSPEVRAQHKFTTYDLMANIVHDGDPGPGKGTYRVHVLHKGTGKWYEMQDLHVIDILPQMIPLSESYIQIFEVRRDIPNPTFGKAVDENVPMES